MMPLMTVAQEIPHGFAPKRSSRGAVIPAPLVCAADLLLFYMGYAHRPVNTKRKDWSSEPAPMVIGDDGWGETAAASVIHFKI